MPRVPITKQPDLDDRPLPFEDDAWLESEDKKERPVWKRVTVLKRRPAVPVRFPDPVKGPHYMIINLIVVHVEGETGTRLVALERLRAGRDEDTFDWVERR